MVGVVGAGARRLRRAITAGHKPTRVRRDLDSIRTDRGPRGRAAGERFRATPVSLGSRLPRRKVFRPVPAAKWKPAISPTRLLHWSSCVGRGSHLAHTGCDSLPELLPGSRDHRSIGNSRRLESLARDLAHLESKAEVVSPLCDARRGRLRARAPLSCRIPFCLAWMSERQPSGG